MDIEQLREVLTLVNDLSGNAERAFYAWLFATYIVPSVFIYVVYRAVSFCIDRCIKETFAEKISFIFQSDRILRSICKDKILDELREWAKSRGS